MISDKMDGRKGLMNGALHPMFEFVSAASNWWEPGQDGTLDIGDISAIFMFFLAVVGAVTALSKWWLKQLRFMIRDQVEEFTKPIQPTANGGKSLPDIANKVETLEQTLLELTKTTAETRQMLVDYIIKDTNRNTE